MSSSSRNRIGLLAALVLTTLAVAPKLSNGFVYDDLFVFLGSDVVHDIRNVPSFFSHNAMYVTDSADPLAVDTYRPLTLTTFAIDSLWTGRAPLGYHVTNWLIHLACVVLVFLLAQHVLDARNRGFAWIAAAWFGVSPWIGEAHLWINGRSDPLCTLLALSALLLFDRGVREHRLSWSWLAALAFFASLLSKEVSIGMLPVLLLWPRFERSRTPFRERVVHLAALATAAVLYLGIRVAVLGGLGANAGRSALVDSASNFGLLFFDSIRALVVPSVPYLRLLSEPYLAVEPPFRWALTVAAVLVVAAAIAFRKRQPAFAWSVAFFAATLAPAVAVTVLVWPGFGRYLYLPFAGLSIGLVDAMATVLRGSRILDTPRGRRVALALVGSFLAVNASLLHGFAHDFHDDGALYGAAIERAPQSAYGYAHAGIALINVGKPNEALEYLGRALELQPHEPKYRIALAQALIRADRHRDAVALAESWLRDGRAVDAPGYLLVIIEAAQTTDSPRARAAAEACVQRFPSYASCQAALEKLDTGPSTPPAPDPR